MTGDGPVLAVDVGGTKIAAARVHADGTLDHLCQAVTQPPGATARSIAQTVVRTARQACGGRRVSAVGVASAGPVDPVTGTVAPINIAAWAQGYPLLADLAEAFPDAGTVLVGDAAAAALGEYRFGAGRGARSMLGMVVSTGVGGGLVLDGRLYPGPQGNAGHVGHLPAGAEFATCLCSCGDTGCVEAAASGPALQEWAAANGRPGLTAEGLAAAARAGDPVAVQAFRRAALALARAVQQASLVCDLDVVVVGGGVAQAGEVLLEPLRTYLADLPGLGFARRPEVRATRLDGTAGLLGAALAAMDLATPALAGPDLAAPELAAPDLPCALAAPGSTFVLREATADDVPAVVALLAADQLGATRDGADTPAELRPYQRAFAAIAADPGQLLLVAEQDGDVVGTLQVSFLPGLARRGAWRAQVEAVRVRSDLRGRGVGAGMVGWVVADARRRGCTLVQLTSDRSRTDAHRFYRHLGFVASHDGFKLRLFGDGPFGDGRPQERRDGS